MKIRLYILLMTMMVAVVHANAQTTLQPEWLAKKFTVNITPDGSSNMVAYLPAAPSGRAVVDCPGGGYSHLAVDHEGHQWAQWFNDQGIAFFVLTYRMPGGNNHRQCHG